MGFLSKAEERKTPDEGKASMPPEPSVLNQRDLEDILKQYQKTNSSIGGLIIDIPKEKTSKITAMVSHFALVEELSSNRSLVLFPAYLDRDLIAHRLKNDLDAEIPLIFSAGSPAEALQKIQPYL